ncbi:MAG: winged helix-turn-helix transcriptional regulator [Xanthomonadales bacterium]|nr:winged helix-turn-helix domain-containing protein [Gammaproteobacteria bacterium]MBT8072566.1 winged helix-turn-helix domain-containing protein [Gammaproteobacteria bacterium]MBT8353960.1 winged helix-turn-helix domain-containing protein [Desulfofustis sp.]NNK03409.1 winged helix-turn-helix transcriptional regulator [Xanthomonadales bacterium]NNL00590.1 winged helix-turn-helix transcriptional regulator [Xanthomonadales bacterium]
MDENNYINGNGNWTFFSNYAHVLVCLAHKPQPTARQMALQVGITERAVQRILARLIEAGVISVEKAGRRNRYTIHRDRRLRHQLESHRTIGEFIQLIDNEDQAGE